MFYRLIIVAQLNFFHHLWNTLKFDDKLFSTFMKLVFIANRINGATGLERMVLYQANYFVENFNYEIDIILLDQKSQDKDSLFKINNKIKTHHLDVSQKGILRYISKIKGINEELKKILPQIVIVCIDEVFGLYLSYFINKECPIIYERHTTRNLNLDMVSNSKKARFKNLVKKTLIGNSGKGYDRFVLLSDEHRKDWKHLDNIEIINNPIVLDTKNKQALLKNKIVVAVGRQDFVKGYDMLLKSWQKVVKVNPDWKLKIYGKISKKLKLKELSAELKISKYIEFHEHTHDITSAYLEASILACSSRIEGFPLVITEAMSIGVPTVSFDCPYGPAAIIRHDEDGLLVSPNKIDDLANSINFLIENKDIRLKFGNRAKENIQRFSPEKTLTKWELLFENLLNQAS